MGSAGGWGSGAQKGALKPGGALVQQRAGGRGAEGTRWREGETDDPSCRGGAARGQGVGRPRGQPCSRCHHMATCQEDRLGLWSPLVLPAHPEVGTQGTVQQMRVQAEPGAQDSGCDSSTCSSAGSPGALPRTGGLFPLLGSLFGGRAGGRPRGPRSCQKMQDSFLWSEMTVSPLTLNPSVLVYPPGLCLLTN